MAQEKNNSLKKRNNLATPMTLVSFDKLFSDLDSPASFRIRGSDDSLVVAASNSQYFNFLQEGAIL